MAIKVPESERAKLAKLLQLPADTVDSLYKALDGCTPELRKEELVNSLAVPSLDRDDVRQIVDVLLSLYWVRSVGDLGPAEAADAIVVAAKESEDARLQNPADGWDRTRERLSKLLSLDHSIGVTAKAAFVAYQFPRHFHSARIVTDARPVFASSASEAPAAFVINHTLKIEVHEDGAAHDWFVAMSSADLRELRKAIDRAIEKQGSLTETLKKTGVPILDWEDQDDS